MSETRALHLDLMKRCLTNSIYADAEVELDANGSLFPSMNPEMPPIKSADPSRIKMSP